MTKLFDLDYIEKELRAVDAKLSRRVTMYVIGGGAMAFHGIKAGTKDIDVIFDTNEEADALADALSRSGYKVPPNMTEAYTKMGARKVLENRDEFRWDIFVKNVIGFHFSERMAKRTKPWIELANIRVTMLSLEDIFTFKALTTRDRDRDDMNTIYEQIIDMDIVHDEVRQQAKEARGKSFPAAFRVGMEEFVEKYGIVYTLPKDIEDLAFHAFLVHRFTLLRASGSTTLATFAKEFGCSIAEVEAAAREAETLGHVTIEGSTVRRR